jgi:hypothetical protein
MAPRSYKIALVALTELSSLLYSGTVFGWAPILLVLRDEGLFSNRCGPGDEWCDGQKEALGMIFTFAAVVYSACGVGVGWCVPTSVSEPGAAWLLVLSTGPPP